MIYRDELNLVEVGDLAQFFGDTDLVLAVAGLQRRGRDLHIFIVIDGEVTPLAIARAQRGDPENVGDEFKPAAVPGPDHGTGAGEPLRFLVLVSLVRRLV